MRTETVDPAGAGIARASAQLAPETIAPSRQAVAARGDELDRAHREERRLALADTWRALWASRLLAWLGGIATVLVFGFGPRRGAFDPPGVTRGLGSLGNLLAAPVARWDAAWYLVIAHYGYRPDLGPFTESRAAFFPLYPLGIRGLSWLGAPPILAGVLISTAALAAALYGIHRLTTLELAGLPVARRRETARLAVQLSAFAPMAFFLSAVYSESLYLALSVGVFWYARQGRWALTGLLAGLATATRSTGLLLLAPALMIYLYGPREDRAPERARNGVARALGRYRLRADVCWLALVPLALGAFCAALSVGGGSALAPFRAQGDWGRHFAGPFVGVWDGLRAGWDGLRQLLSFGGHHVYYPAAGGSPTVAASHNAMLLAFLLAAVPALILALRRLPGAYGAYVIVALALPLSYPVAAQPLMSLPRFLLVLFPLTIACALWLSRHPRLRMPVLVLSASLMAVFVAQFATWHWVA